MEHLLSVLNTFDAITTLTDNVLICGFWDSLILSISTQLDKKNRDLDD